MARIKNNLIGHSSIWSKMQDLLSKNILAHSYLFIGPQGVGKKLFARAFAQAAMCQQNYCGICGDCIKIESNQHESVMNVEPDGAFIKMAQAQDIHQFLNLQSTSKRRFIIIDNAHLMNIQAANSLLKVIEEPPANTHFILISHSDQAVLKTLRSRSQLIRFHPLSKPDILSHTEVPDWILNASQGRLDVIQSLMSPEMDELRLKCFAIIQNADSLNLKATFSELKDTIKDREKALLVIQYWMQVLRDLVFAKNNLESIIHADQKELISNLKSLPQEKIFNLFEITKQIERDIQGNVDRVLAFENWTLELTQ